MSCLEKERQACIKANKEQKNNDAQGNVFSMVKSSLTSSLDQSDNQNNDQGCIVLL